MITGRLDNRLVHGSLQGAIGLRENRMNAVDQQLSLYRIKLRAANEVSAWRVFGGPAMLDLVQKKWT